MNKTQTIILIVITVIVIGFLVYVGIDQETSDEQDTGDEAAVEENGEAPVGEAEVEGASPVSEEGKVVTDEGEPVDPAATPGSPKAPQQTGPISEESVPRSAVKLQVSAGGFEPNEFSVRDGEVITLSVTSVDGQTHVFAFNHPDLKGVAVGVGPGETRAITFNAPEKKGTYQFFCNVPGHAQRGETGTMIVK